MASSFNLCNVHKQYGLTLSGLVLALVLIGLAAMIGMQVVPVVVEYQSIKKAIEDARELGHSPGEIKMAFNKQANTGYITAIRGQDLTIVKQNGEYQVSFAYDKKLHLIGPASLLLEFSGTTEK